VTLPQKPASATTVLAPGEAKEPVSLPVSEEATAVSTARRLLEAKKKALKRRE
jgi:hypothetical protein